MKSGYEIIFGQRGRDYDQAMRLYPNARDAEFLNLFESIDLDLVTNVADIPAGGGYLAKFLPDTCHIDSIEPCAQFLPNHTFTTDVGLDRIKLSTKSYDLIISLAAIHHVREKSTFIGNAYRALTDGGFLCIGDASSNSPVATFLDTFAGQHNGTGHAGIYLEKDTVTDIVHPLGGKIIHNQEKPCPWIFDQQETMLDFCRLLFGLKNVADPELLKALNKYIGISNKSSTVILNWRLRYVTVYKPTSSNRSNFR